MAMTVRLSPAQTQALLYELCVKLGFCLPPEDLARLEAEPPTDVKAFADAVHRAEGLWPVANLRLWRQVRDVVAEHFKRALDAEAS